MGNWSLLHGPEFWSHGSVPQFDVLSVGDTATNVFIRLCNAHVRIREDDHGEWMDLPFGGKVPFDYAVMVDAVGTRQMPPWGSHGWDSRPPSRRTWATTTPAA